MCAPKSSGEKGAGEEAPPEIDGRGETDFRGNVPALTFAAEVDSGLASDDSNARTGNCKLYGLRDAEAGFEGGGAGDIARGLIIGTEPSCPWS